MYKFPRCQVVPLPGHQLSFVIDGRERLRWHCGPEYPRPFFYPLVGPSGATLTRMGHPGAPDHEHHRSIWFAHHKVLGVDFWSDGTEARIRQKEWVCYQDRDEEAVMAVLLGWYDGHDPAELLEQELIVAVRPGEEDETLVELQATFRPTASSLEFGQTNFGFLAVRVAKSISAAFGGGQLTNSEGAIGEAAIFGNRAGWVDYGGPIQPSVENSSNGVKEIDTVVEGITYFDHAANPDYPSHWHVRDDGWMGASVGMHTPITTTQEEPLRLRYLLHAHQGTVNADRANRTAERFASTAGFLIERSDVPHQRYSVRRAG